MENPRLKHKSDIKPFLRPKDLPVSMYLIWEMGVHSPTRIVTAVIGISFLFTAAYLSLCCFDEFFVAFGWWQFWFLIPGFGFTWLSIFAKGFLVNRYEKSHCEKLSMDQKNFNKIDRALIRLQGVFFLFLFCFTLVLLSGIIEKLFF